MSEFIIEEELKKLPHKPGVYIMHNSLNAILYVGKAVDLHSRVRQYFQSGHGHNNSPKISKMVSQISYFEYIITGSELEALVLECNLIKEHRPKYNTLMTDDKGYPYIRITVNEPYPRIMMSHNMKQDHAKYFGPYTNVRAIKDIILLLKRLYLIRSCNLKLPKDKPERPCLYHQLHQCSAPCNDYISMEDYRERINSAISFLNGNFKATANDLQKKMQEYASQMEFEKAAEIRDLIQSIYHIMDRQRITDTNGEDRDIIAYERNDKDAVISIFFIRNGQLLGRENHHMTCDESDTGELLLTEFAKQYYTHTPYIPKEILTELPLLELDILTEYLSQKEGHKITIHTPKKGEKHKLISLAKENASLVLAQDIERIKKTERRTVGATEEIAELLGIKSAARMEAFDISHISGYHSVASMVVFENGMPKKNAYRKFKLKTIEGPDDYSSMLEVLSRRFTDEKLGPFPDVLMMDGGKGQVNIALMVLDSLGIDIPVCGMVKDDHHRTRGLYYNNVEVKFKPKSEALNMITTLQDEAHRFAIEYHKLLRAKDQVHSILDDIKGIGPAKRKALMQHFKDISKIREAEVSELCEVPGITTDLAQSIYNFFH